MALFWFFFASIIIIFLEYTIKDMDNRAPTAQYKTFLRGCKTMLLDNMTVLKPKSRVSGCLTKITTSKK